MGLENFCFLHFAYHHGPKLRDWVTKFSITVKKGPEEAEALEQSDLYMSLWLSQQTLEGA